MTFLKRGRYQMLDMTRAVSRTVKGGILLMAIVLGLVWITEVGANPIPGLGNTGVRDDQSVQTPGTVDSHYAIISSPNGAAPAVISNPPNPAWIANSSSSQWINPLLSSNPSGSNGYLDFASGNYDYRTNLDLTGMDPGAAIVWGRLATDDFLVDVRINGVSIGLKSSVGFHEWTNFQITSGFQVGQNTIDFVVYNSGGPTGLRVEMGGNASPAVGPVPVPPFLTVNGGYGQATANWNSVPGSAGYDLKRSNTHGGPYTTIAANLTTNSFTDTGLTNGITYYYVVTALNASGESANSNETTVVPASTWRIADASTVNGDTRLLWVKNNGAVAVWSVDNSGSPSYGPIYGPYPGYTAVRIAAGAGGLEWVLWNRTDGQATVWLMGQSAPYSNVYEASYGYGPYGGWTATDIAIGSDGKARLLWSTPDGRMAVWTVDNQGNASYGPIYGPVPGWTAQRIAVGPDGLLRVIWNRGDDRLALWTMSGEGTFQGSFGFGPYPGWKAVDVAIGGDNRTRLLWATGDGKMAVWSVDGAGNASYGPIYGPVANWTAQNMAAGPDGLTRVIWSRNDNRIALWLMGADNVFQGSYGFGPY